MDSVLCQYNKSAILLKNNVKMSISLRTKHINLWYYFIKDCIKGLRRREALSHGINVIGPLCEAPSKEPVQEVLSRNNKYS